MSFPKLARLVAAALSFTALPESQASADKPVKVFIGAMFEIGQNTGDRAGELQHWSSATSARVSRSSSRALSSRSTAPTMVFEDRSLAWERLRRRRFRRSS